MKEFLKLCKIDKISKSDLANLTFDYQNEIIEYYVKNAHNAKYKEQVAENINSLFKKMNNNKFIGALKMIRKDSNMGINPGMVIVIAGFIERCRNSEEVSSETIEKYNDLIIKILNKRIKAIQKKVDLPEDAITELLVIMPSPDYANKPYITEIYVLKMLRKLYAMADAKDIKFEDAKTIKKLFKQLFGKELLDLVAVSILLEKKENIKNMSKKQQEIWNTVTTFALDEIEKQKDKKHIGELIEYYCKRRNDDMKKQRDVARRIQFTSVDAEKYPKIAKCVGKLSKNQKITNYL